MIRIFRCDDEQFVYDSAYESWDMISDDGSVDRNLFFPNMSMLWLEAINCDSRLGVFLATRHNEVTYEAHTIMRKYAAGHAVAAGKKAIEWMFENTPCETIITHVPSFNIVALAAAKRAGFKEYGIVRKSFKKNNVLYDQHALQIVNGE